MNKALQKKSTRLGRFDHAFDDPYFMAALTRKVGSVLRRARRTGQLPPRIARPKDLTAWRQTVIAPFHEQGTTYRAIDYDGCLLVEFKPTEMSEPIYYELGKMPPLWKRAKVVVFPAP